MSSQQSHKALHTKILDVFRSKSLKKNAKDPRQTLFFKIKPQKSVSELIIPYRDLKDNFPYALVEYYETKLKIKNQTAKSYESLLTDNDKNPKKIKNSIIEEKKQQKPPSKSKQREQKHEKQQQKQNQSIEQQQNPHMMLILDYDYYLQQHDIPITKTFHSVFSQTEPNENRYLKDLNNDQNNMYARRNKSNSSNYESRRKKTRIDYHE